jgi:hypothetical protein
VGGCGSAETENHLFFNCPILSVTWREIVKWIGIPIVLPEGGYDHLVMFKGLICGKAKIKEMLGVIWISNIYSIWKARNAMIFNQTDFSLMRPRSVDSQNPCPVCQCCS